MKFILSSALLLAMFSSKQVDGQSFDGFTYYELGGLGPSNWPFLQFEGNQCGGTEGQSGYGQSPVSIGQPTLDHCNTNMVDYNFDGGDCKWDQLKFSINDGGLKVEPKQPGACNFGKMNIPEAGDGFDALHFNVHTYSGHQMKGRTSVLGIEEEGFFPAELHVVHEEENKESMAVFGTVIDVGMDPHPVFEGFLQGWEAVAQRVENECSAVRRQVRGLKENLQQKIECPAAGTSVYMNGTTPMFPSSMPNVYELPTTKDYGLLTYKGGLTVPGCTENVNWNIVDAPMMISADQLSRLEKLVLCYVSQEFEDDAQSTVKQCTLGTVASETGSTSRPPQDLQGRKIVHRCHGGPPVSIVDVGVLPENAADFVKLPPPEENLNNDARQCDKTLYEDCSEDKRYNSASPNLRANDATWNDLSGFWMGTANAYDARGQPLQPRFASTLVNGTLPYNQEDFMMFINRTVVETRYYEHIYRVYKPASFDFCQLPVPEFSANKLGEGNCGENGYALTDSVYGTSTHEKDGQAAIFYATGRYLEGEGAADPIGGTTMYSSLTSSHFQIAETLTFDDDSKVKMSGSGQYFIISDVPPYSENPLAYSYNVQLKQVSEENFIAQLQETYEDFNVLESDQLDANVDGDCLDDEFCPTEEQWNAVDPLTTTSPYEDEPGVKVGFIVLFVLLAFVIVAGAAYFLHKKAVEKQANRYQTQFAAAIADTIHLDGTSPEELEAEFKKIDADGNGYLEKDELRMLVKDMDQRDFDAMFAAIDIDGNGHVEFTEFCAFVALLTHGPPKAPKKDAYEAPKEEPKKEETVKEAGSVGTASAGSEEPKAEPTTEEPQEVEKPKDFLEDETDVIDC